MNKLLRDLVVEVVDVVKSVYRNVLNALDGNVLVCRKTRLKRGLLLKEVLI